MWRMFRRCKKGISRRIKSRFVNRANVSDFTDYMETAIRDWMSQGTAMDSAPGTVYVALHTSDPGESPDGSTEVSASDYGRVDVTTGSGFSTSLNPTQFSNANELAFGEATNDWGTISHVSLWTSNDTTGDCLASFALSSTKTINSGDEAIFNAGDLSFEIA